VKIKLILTPVVVLLLAFVVALASQSSASAAPSMWISGTPASGQFNNGVISPTGQGVTEASTKLYYLSSSQATSRPSVGLTLSGSGFEPNKSVGFGVEGVQGEPTEPWGTGNLSLQDPIKTDGNGGFEYSVPFSRAAPSAYNKFDSYGGEKLVIYPVYAETKQDISPDRRIAGVQVTLTVRPTVIVLPRELDPITIYAGADYSFSAKDSGVASMIIDDSSRQVRLAVAGISMRGPGNTALPKKNDAWQLSNGVTVSPNADNSQIVFRTTESGVSGELSETFSILGTGASVINDGYARVVGFPKTSDAQIATFNLIVKKTDRSVSPELDSFTFTNNKTANDSVTFKATPPNLAIKDLLIVDPLTKQRQSSIETLGGLVLTANPGPIEPTVTFSGVPKIDGGTDSGSYEVVWVTTDGEELASSINVEISTGDVYALMYDANVIGGGVYEYWQKGVAVTPTRRAVLARSGAIEAPVRLTVENAEGLDGIDIESDNRWITLSGTPNFSGEKTFYVNVALADGVSGTLSQKRVPFTVFADDAVYQLSFDREKIEVPVGKELSANVNMLTEPRYEGDIVFRAFTLTGDGVTSTGYGGGEWNGLTITGYVNIATKNTWLEVSGKAEREGTVELTYAPTRGSNMSSAKLTIAAHKDEDVADTPAETEVVTNADDPIVTTSGDVRYETPTAGETTKIIYIISNDVSQTGGGTTVNNYINIQAVNLALPDGTLIPLSNLNDNDTAAGPYTGAPNSYYFDRASGQIILYVTPETAGDYRCNVYYKDSTAMRVQPINLIVTETTNYYYTETKGGGGGCSTGTAVGLAAMSMTAAVLIGARRRNRHQR
jgi:hypothetical protein